MLCALLALAAAGALAASQQLALIEIPSPLRGCVIAAWGAGVSCGDSCAAQQAGRQWQQQQLQPRESPFPLETGQVRAQLTAADVICAHLRTTPLRRARDRGLQITPIHRPPTTLVSLQRAHLFAAALPRCYTANLESHARYQRPSSDISAVDDEREERSSSATDRAACPPAKYPLRAIPHHSDATDQYRVRLLVHSSHRHHGQGF